MIKEVACSLLFKFQQTFFFLSNKQRHSFEMPERILAGYPAADVTKRFM